ncbi:hypothetical protein V2H45_22975 [Tumidithrix elongata RA019]|uniref:Uncharacterized protein n=1 Tax=Tumidithrix elongata BACA0141 TaxID=2716417 RepID=A0AAW9Q9D6_9CYAN|nr:hypothetical protein [Tumidithrix elongata RA019]
MVKGKVKGKAEERNQIALKMLQSNISIDAIAQFTGLTLKQIEKLQKAAVRIPKGIASKKSP